MKKLITIQVAAMSLFLLVTTVKISYAQDSHVAILINMVNSKLNYGEMNSSLKHYSKNVRGLQAGLSWQAGITKNFSILSEAYFISKGGRLTGGNPLNEVGSTLRLYTAEIPVLARIHVGGFYFNTGPYANYIFSGKKSESESSESISFGREADDFTRWETGMQAGAGYEFKLKKRKLALDFRYTHGMTSVSRSADLYSRTINVTVLIYKSRKREVE
jgi:hypothetical protein